MKPLFVSLRHGILNKNVSFLSFVLCLLSFRLFVCLFVCVSVYLFVLVNIIAQGPAAHVMAEVTVDARIDVVLSCVVVGNVVRNSYRGAEREEARRLLGAAAAESTPAQDASTLGVRTGLCLGASGILTWVLELCLLSGITLIGHHLWSHVIALLAVADHGLSEEGPHPERVEKLWPAEGQSLNLWLYLLQLLVGTADEGVLGEGVGSIRV